MVTEAKIEPKFNLLLNYLFFKLQKACVVVKQVKSTRHSLNYIIKLYILNCETGPCFQLRWHFVAERLQLCVGLWKKAEYRAVKQRQPVLAFSLSTTFLFFCACVMANITTASSSTIFFSRLFAARYSVWSHFLCKCPGFTIWWCVASALCCN